MYTYLEAQKVLPDSCLNNFQVDFSRYKQYVFYMMKTACNSINSRHGVCIGQSLFMKKNTP